MRFTSFAFFSGLLTVASAHFSLLYPEPRGVRVEDNEVNFCDSYTTAATNRSQFPLSGGFVSLTSGHHGYTVGVIASTAQNPTSFDNFTTAVNYFTFDGTGSVCFPINLNSTGISGIRDGANVTLQIVYNGGDGNLYQCADVTLNSTFTIPSSISCTNGTSSSSSSSSSLTSASSAASSTASSSTSGAEMLTGFGFMTMLSFATITFHFM